MRGGTALSKASNLTSKHSENADCREIAISPTTAGTGFEYAPILRVHGFDPYVMTAVVDGSGRVLVQNSYRDGRVSEETANGDVYRYDYRFVKDEIVETIVNEPSAKRKLHFEHGRQLVKDE